MCYIHKRKVNNTLLAAELQQNLFDAQAKFFFQFLTMQSVFSEQNWTLSSKKECFVLNTGRWLEGPLHLYMPFAVRRSCNLSFIKPSIKLVMDILIKSILVNKREDWPVR